MTITVLLFAQAREHAGASTLRLDLPESSRVADALAALVRLHPGLEALVAHLALAVDGRLVKPEAPLAADAELALLPPVSGG